MERCTGRLNIKYYICGGSKRGRGEGLRWLRGRGGPFCRYICSGCYG